MASNATMEELLSKVPIDKMIAWLRKIFSQKIYKDEVVVPQKDAFLIESLRAQYRSKSDRIGE